MMLDHNNRNTHNFSKYSDMTSEDLVQLLRSDSESLEEQGLSTDELMEITGILAERERSSDSSSIRPMQDAWDSFQQNYLDLEDICRTAKTAHHSKPWLRRIIAAAAIIALIIFIPLTARALNWKQIFKTIANWTNNVFYFSSDDPSASISYKPSSDSNNEALNQAVAEISEKVSAISACIPEGYVLDSINITQSSVKQECFISYVRNNHSIRILISSYLADAPVVIEKNNEPIEIYQEAGIDYYIFKNSTDTVVTWIEDSYHYIIYGNISADEIKKITHSM